MKLFTKQKHSQTWRMKLWLPGGREEGGIDWEFGMNMYTMLSLKQITNKDVLYSTGNSTQYSAITQMGK